MKAIAEALILVVSVKAIAEALILVVSVKPIAEALILVVSVKAIVEAAAKVRELSVSTGRNPTLPLSRPCAQPYS